MSPAGKLSVEIREESTLEEVATIVCAALDESGISVVLSGGAAVSIYSDNEYESYDLDFVPMGLARRVDRVMESLDFSRKQRHWVHQRSRYWVEFPAGPVAIGEEIIHDFAERSSPAGRLRILHPTECVIRSVIDVKKRRIGHASGKIRFAANRGQVATVVTIGDGVFVG